MAQSSSGNQSQVEIPEPVVVTGPRRKILTDVYLHAGAAVLRNLVWYLTAGDGKDFDRITSVVTPGLGTGHVRIAICKPHPVGAATESDTKPLLLVLEGGGFILGQPEDGQKHDRRLADELDAIVISIDYAKAPKYPYPHALLQAYTVLQWAFSLDAQKLDIRPDPCRVAILGNSAGGNLAAVLSLLLSFSKGSCARFSQGLPSDFRQVAQILLYPSTAQHQSYGTRYRSTDDKARSRSLPVEICELMEDSYLPSYINRDQMFVAPLTAPTHLLEGLRPPPALVLTAGLDCLKEEAAAYVDKLRKAGVAVCTHEYADAVHGFSHYTKGSDYRREDVEDCWGRISETLRTAFLPERSP